MCELLPPPDSLVEHYWPSGAAEGWYKCTCQGEEQTDEGEPASMVLDEDGNVENLYGVTLEDLQWRLTSHCPHPTLQHQHPTRTTPVYMGAQSAGCVTIIETQSVAPVTPVIRTSSNF